MIEGEYKYLIIDAQYYLRRNWCVVKDKEGQTEFGIIDSFLWTILKLCKQVRPEKTILLFDKRPYKKESVISQYKKDRYLVEEDYYNIESQLSGELSDEKRKELEEKLAEVTKERDKFRMMGRAKYLLLSEFSTMGFATWQKQGYEADDLAYLLGRYCSEHSQRALLVSSDSDWIYSSLPYVDVYRMNKSDNSIYAYDQVKSSVPESHKSISLYEFGRLKEIVQDSHNNVELGVNINFDEAMTLLENNNLGSIKILNDFFEAMNGNLYYNELLIELEDILKSKGSISYKRWSDYFKFNHPAVYFNYYWSIVNKFNRSLYTPIEE